MWPVTSTVTLIQPPHELSRTSTHKINCCCTSMLKVLYTNKHCGQKMLQRANRIWFSGLAPWFFRCSCIICDPKVTKRKRFRLGVCNISVIGQSFLSKLWKCYLSKGTQSYWGEQFEGMWLPPYIMPRWHANFCKGNINTRLCTTEIQRSSMCDLAACSSEVPDCLLCNTTQLILLWPLKTWKAFNIERNNES